MMLRFASIAVFVVGCHSPAENGTPLDAFVAADAPLLDAADAAVALDADAATVVDAPPVLVPDAGSGPDAGSVCAHGGWTHTTLASSSSSNAVGQYNSVTVDAARTVHVLYYDTSDQHFYYMRKPHGGVWSREVISSGNHMGARTDIAADGMGGVHISFDGVSSNDLNYGYRSPAGVWKFEKIDNTRGERNSIVVGADGVVHVSYIVGATGISTTGTVVYARRATDGTWTKSTTPATASDLSDTTIVVNPQGVIRILYKEPSSAPTPLIKLVQRPSPTTAWTVETVVSDGAPDYPSLARDANDGLHVAYYRYWSDSLAYAYKPAGGSWATRVLDLGGPGGAGLWPEIAVDGTGRVHIIHSEPADRLRYAIGTPNGTWSYETLDYIVTPGQFSSIATDPDGGAHVTYYKSTTNELEYAYRCP